MLQIPSEKVFGAVGVCRALSTGDLPQNDVVPAPTPGSGSAPPGPPPAVDRAKRPPAERGETVEKYRVLMGFVGINHD